MPSPEYKHFCRVCNKGFICGSALGGHMRAHSSSDDVFAGAGADDGDEPARGRGPSDDQWDAAGTSSSTTPAYALRANPNRQVRSCQVCKNCGKEFTSWERFLDHGRCNSDDEGRAEGSGSPRHSLSPSEADDGEEDPAVSATEWSKGKRSRRVKSVAALDDAPATSSRRFMSGEEEDLANCLVMLSSSNTEQAATVTRTNTQQKQSASVSRERDRGPQLLHQISFLAQAPDPVMALPSATTTIQYVSPAPRGMFECKACKKEFTSHQALGGHRASHKKVKGCFAARLESNVSKTPSHAAPVDRNEDNGKAVVVEGSTHATTDTKPSCNAGTDGDTNVGTTSETAAALSMALAPAAAFNVAEAPSGKKNAKMHECSVCHRLFTSGQALGGHKRCHWLTSSTADPTIPVANLSVPPITEDLVGAVRHQLMLRPMVDASEPALDLTISAKLSTLTPAPGSSTFHLDASAQALHLQSSVEPGNASHRNTCGHDDNDVAATASNAAQDESESISIKRARLTDLKDVVRMDEEASEPWLQVGIGSSSAGGDEKNSRE